jgi:hypothetical protein
MNGRVPGSGLSWVPTFGEAERIGSILEVPSPSGQRNLDALEFWEAGRIRRIPVVTGEFWTSRQRAAHSLHEISYRACFKPQLPRFFLLALSRPADVVFDPFAGRGTVALEAALNARVPWASDCNPLSRMLLEPRLNPPSYSQVRTRLQTVDWAFGSPEPPELLAFYHPQTLREINALKAYLGDRQRTGNFDAVDAWIRMVAINRLTGHSPGFFSVRTLPPNQAVSVVSQEKINRRLGQTPPFRDVPRLILAKTASLLRDVDEFTRRRLEGAAAQARLFTQDCRRLDAVPDAAVDLVITSPPFLDVVDYQKDNWLRGWFAGIDSATVPILRLRRLEDWTSAMAGTLGELRRILRPGGHLVFEVGEVRRGSVLLERIIAPLGSQVGLRPEAILVHTQAFTKTSHCWGIENGRRGTNTQRIVLFSRPS